MEKLRFDSTLDAVQDTIDKCFVGAFGRTPLRQRLEDIFNKSIELHRYSDHKNMKEETGDLLASVLQLCNEAEWDAGALITETMRKIESRKDQYRSLGRKIKVALLGGAFDPITLGHIKLAQLVLDTSKTFDEVWLVPCRHHLYNKNMSGVADRMAMCDIACECDGRIKTFDYEVKNNLGGETYQFVKMLMEEGFAKNQYDFSYIIGLDNANTFDKWVNYEDLERLIRFVVVPRKGVERDVNVDWYLKPPHIFLATENNVPEISSTEIRDRLKRGIYSDNILPFMDRRVLKYIDHNGMYG